MKYLEKTAKYGLILALFAPLVITTSTFYPFVFGKALFFQIIVEVVFFVWLFLFLNKPQKYKPQVSKLGGAIFAFLGVFFIASIFGFDRTRSIWGSFERMEGWISLAHFGAFFLLLSVFFQTKKDWLLGLQAFVGVSVISVFYGLAQQWQLPFVVAAESSALAGPLGNTTLFGSFLLIPAGLAVFLFFWDKHRQWRFFYAFAFGLLAIGVLLTGAQGPTLGLVLGFFLFLILGLLFYKKREYKKYFVALGVLVLVGGSLFVVFIEADFVKESPVLSKFRDFSFQSSSFKSRFLNWKISWQGVKEKPMLGWGQGGNFYVYAKNFNPKVLAYSDNWFDKPHNKYLEVAVSSGVVGLAFYLAIFFFAFLYLKRNKNLPTLARLVLLGLLFGYLVQLCFLFDTTASYLAIFLLFGLINWFSFQREVKKEASREGSGRPLGFKVGLGLVLLAALSLSVYHVNLRPYLESRKAKKSTEYVKLARASRDKEPYLDRAYRNLKGAQNWQSFGQSLVAQELAVSMLRFSSQFEDEKIKPFLDHSREKLKRAIEKHPEDPRLHLVLGDLYLKTEKGKKAEAAFKTARDLAPKRPGAYYKLGQVYLKRGEEKEALQSANKALELNKDYADSWRNRAQLNLALGNSSQGTEDLLKAFQAGLSWKEAVQTNLNSEELKRLTSILARYLNSNPRDAEIHITLSLFYISLDKQDQAVSHYKKAVDIDPQIEAEFKKYSPKANSL